MCAYSIYSDSFDLLIRFGKNEMKITDAKNQLELLKQDFLTADLPKKLQIAHDAAFLHPYFWHYTSLDNALSMIEKKEMWLTRSNSLSLDDHNESRKFGTEAIHRRSYIGCFTHHSGESAAMWALYCKPDEKQVRISVPSEAMKKWVDYLRTDSAEFLGAETVHGKKIETKNAIEVSGINFVDVLYASVKGDRKGEKHRDGLIRWRGLKSENSFTAENVRDSQCTAKMKDVEWEFEDESRLVVTAKRERDCVAVKRIKISVTEEFLASMSFTLSPWLCESEIRDYRAFIRDAVRKGVNAKLLGLRRPYIMPSTLSGALVSWAKTRQG